MPDDTLRDRLAIPLHFATSGCKPGDCPGVEECCYAEGLPWIVDALLPVVRAEIVAERGRIRDALLAALYIEHGPPSEADIRRGQEVAAELGLNARTPAVTVQRLLVPADGSLPRGHAHRTRERTQGSPAVTPRTGPKRERTKLAKAELWMHLAVAAERWSRECDGTEPGSRAFDEWPPEDPLVTLCRTYDLTPRDLARLCQRVAQEAENRAIRGGYDDYWDAVPPQGVCRAR